MGYYNYHPDSNGGEPLNCNECGKPINQGDPVYFIDFESKPIKAEHAPCTWERTDRIADEQRRLTSTCTR